MMKKGLLTMFLSMTAVAVQAEYVGPRTGCPKQATVAEAKQMNDDTRLSLKGFITGHLRGDHYLFRDSTGEISVEIEDEVWRGIEIGPDTNVILHGELEHESGSLEVEVDRLEVAKTGSRR
ncbi:NirD/YgiW/YdeI family stress tolerance protein [Prosthecochloris sp.]|uniref:NirD/YgiW/YdeI family stress tolerance protein n=1 Tax=Prosthecochloris sp. TaxID=290513 RepID=UPI00257BB75B|nr:NirD/YgiW/YdeI family stress tolerance protein [Prosthecochloris sp.]